MPLKPAPYAVIGNPVAHSLSPDIHARFAAQTGQSMVYDRILAPLDGFVACVEAFRQAQGCGLNVTVPFKTQAYEYATARTERAEQAGAVNTLRFEGDTVWGDNTDGVGLVADLTQRMGVVLTGARVVLLGAGGAARGVVQPLLAAGVAGVHVAARQPAQAQAWVARMGNCVSCGALAGLSSGFDGIINATSAGLHDAAPAVPPAAWQGVQWALDMMYGSQPTPFMRQARAAGCPQVEDGLGMLVGQAAAAFAWWRGVHPDAAAVYRALRP